MNLILIFYFLYKQFIEEYLHKSHIQINRVMAAFSLPSYMAEEADDWGASEDGAFGWGGVRRWSQLYETERMVYMEFYAEIRNNVRVMPENTDFIPNWATEPSERALRLLEDGESYELGPRGQITDGQWNSMLDWLNDEETGGDDEDDEDDDEDDEEEEDAITTTSGESSNEEQVLPWLSTDEEEEEEDAISTTSEESSVEEQVSPWPSSDEEEDEIREWPRIDLTSNMEWLPPAQMEIVDVMI